MTFFLNKFSGSKFFLLDAIGAFTSAVLLLFIYLFDSFFGMPAIVLTMFIGIASACFLYSVTLYFAAPVKWKLYLKLIAILNLCYCIFTMYHVVLFFKNLTVYGKFYFVGEVLVIMLLSFYELTIAGKATDN